MSTRPAAASVLVAFAVAVALEAGSGLAAPDSIGDGAVGAALLGGGALALATPRGVAGGALLLLTGVLWFAGTYAPDLVFVHRGPLLLLVLAYPRLWPASRAGALVAVAGIATALVPVAARSAEVTLALATAAVLVALARHRASAGIERRVSAAALAATAAIGAALAVASIGRLAGGSLDEFALWSYETAVALVAIGLAADLRWGRWERAAISELVADLGALERAEGLRERLAGTLGDPALELGFATGDGFADEAGETIDVGRAGRAASYATQGDRRVAVLVHDPALLEDRRLLSAALAAAGLMAANLRMSAEVRAGIDQLRASRRRLVEAAIDQRRTLEEELRTGAEHRLDLIGDRLRALDGGEPIDELVLGVERARKDLRRFAQGIHPASLTDHGLRAALDEATELMPCAVTVAAPGGRLPQAVETTLYFFCTEALANVGKYARAERVDITVTAGAGFVETTVADDGVGGASLEAGTGLRGLADRIAALGGTLDVTSPAGAGTRLFARIPI